MLSNRAGIRSCGDAPITSLHDPVLISIYPRETRKRHCLVRQRADNLRVIGVVGGEINIDFLVGAGAVGVVDTCSVTLGEFARTGPNFARYVVAGRVRALDNT